MAKKLKDGANKKKHSKLIANKKQKIAAEKKARQQKLKAMYAQLNDNKSS
jgi:hypothetical protein